uniref:Chromosome 16 open reading frame 87 n=1 Tax=Anas platyrhynchos platyrhynchos TaxID=8840 RepID=A0A493T8A2_ANAPP
MSSSRAKKVKMATKSCPECDQQVPVACKSCPCGYIFISRKLLHAKRAERSPPIAENKSEAKRRRTERVKREKINSAVNKDLENRKRSRSNSHSDHSRRGRGRPKSASAKKHEEERGYWSACYTTPSGNEALVFAVRRVARFIPTLLDLTSLRS